MKLLTTTISFFLGLTLVAAKTDIGAPCTSSTTYVGGIFTRIFYIPDTGELCELIDCGGGRAPPKTTVPGCPLYSGTEPVPTHYLPGWGPNGRLIETTTTTTSGAAEATSETSAITATAGAGGSVYASASASASTDTSSSSSSSSSSATATDAAAAQITGPSASDSARDSASTALTSRSGATGSAAAAANATTTGVVRGNDAAAGFRVRSAGVAGVVGAVVLVGGVML
ncbi:uncharacterized protein BO95DRAFT_516008 [Aspergillus brunneoviolaceus CBS 621.78]|uniref:Uncharacterized protein n=1 Tax=Aspergillus brunneoviolaceus CBS 621.78 TaxID=1450534 RepID=A0ACD1G3V2_9EURO|nr:hypothetical protein BO95DRAFT_516008 [Aspergillus brunneoviolaceus CBS 621.78]RAH43947.1 hypothetical protein BO95DRAFT_516008 [Aspergillus brunneoviolaceus CBS 621.78]